METDKELLSSWSETQDNQQILNEISDMEDHVSQSSELDNLKMPEEQTTKNLGDIR
jgi:hypothetical protein